MSRVLVTGAGGFVGKALSASLAARGCEVIAITRRANPEIAGASAVIVMEDIAGVRDWESKLQRIDAVIHLAARAHVLRERTRDPSTAFRRVNVEPTVSLFEASQRTGVGRFVFLSSIGVNGNATGGVPFRESDPPNPVEDYAKSKWDAEQALLARVRGSSTALTIVRPSLIYGPGAKGNFRRLMRWVGTGWPVPTAAGGARRNFASLNELCELLWRCVYHPAAIGETFVAADRESVSLEQLIRVLARAMHSRTRPVAVPPVLLRLAGRVLRRDAEVQRLIGSLEVDASKARRLLDWPANADFEEEIGMMVREFDKEQACR